MKKLFFLLLFAFAAYSCQDDVEDHPVTIEESTEVTRASGSGSSDYYWYNGKIVPLTRNEEYVNVVYDNKLVKSSKSEVIVKSATRNEETKQMFPFFERGEGAEPIGTSDIFYLQLKESSEIELLEKIAAEFGVKVIEEIPHTPRWYTLSILGSEFDSSIEASNYFYETGKFENVDPAFMFNFQPAAEDTDFFRQWGLKNNSYPGVDIDVIPAWGISRGAGVKVAVVDTPFESSHNDLDGSIHALSYNAKLKKTPSAVYDANSFYNSDIHGTHVAGIIAAEKNGSLVTGVAYESKIMRVSHDLFFTPTMSSELASGINWAWQNGADIINCSWGDRDSNHNVHMELHSTVLEQAILNAMNQGRGNKGCVVVFSAGNSGHLGAIINYPASFHDNILVVGSIDESGLRSSFSGNGAKLDVVAPGGAIWSTIPPNTIYPLNGTSMAAPHVSGIAALILSMRPEATRQQVTDIIVGAANLYPSRNNNYGYGRVDAFQSILPFWRNSLTISGTDYATAYAYNTYSVPAPPQGITFAGWTISPSSYSTNGGTSGTTLNVRFTSEDTYILTAKYRLPDNSLVQITKMVFAGRVSHLSWAPQIIYSGDWVTFTAEGITIASATDFDWDVEEGGSYGYTMNRGRSLTIQVSNTFSSGTRVVVACRAAWDGKPTSDPTKQWSDYTRAFVYPPDFAPAPSNGEEEESEESLEATTLAAQ